ncbi:hypothetical protein WN51_04258 [Melipona quadrifasciata]|uniref:Uncharacterized protein n=1 Tax=Melipona quadrifasciata TaxID=166423 RepID=A0A0M8ZTC2_9HYME|nr:hypothetical protein WN51_04258 [Melipona quadrifasciata]
MDWSTSKDAGSCLARHHAFTRTVYGIIMQRVARVAVTMPRCRPTRERNRLFIRCVSQLFTGRDNMGDSGLTQRKLYIFERSIVYRNIENERTSGQEYLRSEFDEPLPSWFAEVILDSHALLVLRENFKLELKGFLFLSFKDTFYQVDLEVIRRRQASFAMKATLMGMKNSSKELSSELDAVGESCYDQRGMLKHVSVSPWRGRADSVSLASSGGTSSCGSGSPSPGHTPPPSRASSCASLAPLTALSSFSPADATSQQCDFSFRNFFTSNKVISFTCFSMSTLAKFHRVKQKTEIVTEVRAQNDERVLDDARCSVTTGTDLPSSLGNKRTSKYKQAEEEEEEEEEEEKPSVNQT